MKVAPLGAESHGGHACAAFVPAAALVAALQAIWCDIRASLQPHTKKPPHTSHTQTPTTFFGLTPSWMPLQP